MPLTRRLLLLAAVVTVTAITVPVAALASGGPSKQPSAPATSRSASPQAAQTVGAGQGISDSRIQAGLVAAKTRGGNTADGVRAFAGAAQVPLATAQHLVDAAFGTASDRGFVTPATVAALASRLGITAAQARSSLTAIIALNGEHGVDPAAPAFGRIASSIGVTGQQLAAALDAVKAAAGK